MKREKIYRNGWTFMEMAYTTAQLRDGISDDDDLMSSEAYCGYRKIVEVQITKTVFRRSSYQEY